MSRKIAKSIVWQSLIYSAAATMMLVTISSTTFAQSGRLFGGLKKSNCTDCRCPDCDEYCKVSCVKVDEHRLCFKVDYRTICIPKVKLPWDRCCEPRCAEARSVKILVAHAYKCPKCKCKWEVMHPEPCQPGTGEYEGDHHHLDGPPIEGLDYIPGEVMPQPPVAEPVGNQPLNRVPVAPQPATTGSTQNQYRDYYAPAKFSGKK